METYLQYYIFTGMSVYTIMDSYIELHDNHW